MKEYTFQFTKMGDTVIVLMLCIAAFISLMFLGIYLSMNKFMLIFLDTTLAIILFQLLKKKARRSCKAKITDNSVEFEFDQFRTRKILFDDLVSYKFYDGKNGPILYLPNNIDDFRIAANNNFCKPDDFIIFCQDILVRLETFKNKPNSHLVHKGSIFATTGMLYFLTIASLVYLISFYFETSSLRIAIGIGGGFYCTTMWLLYYIQKTKKRD